VPLFCGTTLDYFNHCDQTSIGSPAIVLDWQNTKTIVAEDLFARCSGF
jgi:hypothetical protein